MFDVEPRKRKSLSEVTVSEDENLVPLECSIFTATQASSSAPFDWKQTALSLLSAKPKHKVHHKTKPTHLFQHTNERTRGHFNTGPAAGALSCFRQRHVLLKRKELTGFYRERRWKSVWRNMKQEETCWVCMRLEAGSMNQDQGLTCVCFENKKGIWRPLETQTLISLSVMCRPLSVGSLSTQPFNMHIKD